MQRENLNKIIETNDNQALMGIKSKILKQSPDGK